MSATARRKLWEQQEYQCPVLGTCLSMAELRKLSRKLGLNVPANATDYELHVRFVRESSTESPVSAFINKYLDKKFRTHLRQFAKAQDETTIEAMWDFARKTGDIPGPFWAVMSHPLAGHRLLAKVFGEIHMLSHLMGAANRADIKRVSRLETRLDELGQALTRVQAARRSQKLEWAVRVKDLEDRLEAERAERLKLARQLREPRPVLAAAAAAHAAEDELLASAGLRDEIHRQASIIEELYRENSSLRASLEETRDDLARAEAELAGTLPCGQQDCTAAEGGCPCPELAGKSVLYVGGRCNLVRHYRSMVERAGGRFHHHDGGVEHSSGELYGKLATADVVLCPVDCVSHDACLAVKKACKNCMKPFMMLRSSGLTALARSLEEVANSLN